MGAVAVVAHLEEDVFWFDVTMDDAATVQCFECMHDLSEDASGSPL